ncbi:MAG: hypothetical protein Q8O15_03425 [Rectinemataceae bacterium]|nr:hypothetical protein [Rectinemataceae bacterium]
MDNTAEQFWKDFEIKTGEKLVVASMGQFFEPGEKVGKWGLVFLTDVALHYKHMPSNNSFLSLFSMNKSPEPTGKEIELVYPLESILSADTPKRTWKDRLFGTPFQGFSITVADLGGGQKKVSFSTDPSNKLAEKLQALLGKG